MNEEVGFTESNFKGTEIKLNETGIKECSEFKDMFEKTIKHSIEHMPDSRERSEFLRKLEETILFGTNIIASKTGNFKEIINS